MSKTIKLTILIVVALLPSIVLAHGGVQKSAGNVTVYITQSPISPFVDEQVQFTFVLGKTDSLDRLRQWPVTVTLIDTFYGDESKDKVLLTEQKITDANGAFQFTYIFPKENYFDIDLKFKDPITSKEENTGFLVQPRLVANNKTNYYRLISVAIGSLIVGAGLYAFINKKKGHYENV